MQSGTLCGGVAYHHVRPTPEPPRCPGCGRGREADEIVFHSWRLRTVEHLGVEQPTYLVLRVPKYACRAAACPRKYFTPSVAEAPPRARTSRRLQQTAVRRYRRGRAALREIERQVREDFHAGTGKSSVLRWHLAAVAADFPRPERLPFSGVLCIDEVYDRVGGRRVPTWTCVDPLAGLTIRIPIARADAASLAAAMRQVRALGANPKVIVSDLWAAYPEALAQVWPRAERQVCWFHVMQWVTRTLAELLKQVADTWPEPERKALRRLRFRFLAGPQTLEAQVRAGRLSSRDQAALAGLWALLRGTAVEDALRLRDDLRAIVTESASRREARARFAALRRTWPERFQPRRTRLDGWRPGQPLPPKLPDTPPATPTPADDLEAFLHEIMAYFVRHFEWMITYLDHPGVPRTNNHAERGNRRYRAASRPRYGWKTKRGHRAMLVALQGFDTS
jgi:hypothetical protein